MRIHSHGTAPVCIPSLVVLALSLGSVFAPYPVTAATCPLEMIAYWRADSDANDHMLNHDGTLMGGADFADGHCEQAFLLDGVDDCVSIPSSSDFNLSQTDAKTIALWWNAEALNTPLMTRRDSGNYDRGLLFMLEPTGYCLHLEIEHWAKFSAAYRTGQWFQTAVTKDGGTWRLYHNGSELPISSTRGWPYSGDATKNIPLLIGQDGAMSVSNFNGLIDEIAVFNKVLGSEEILALYQSSCHYCDRVPTPIPTLTPEGYKTPTPSPSPRPTASPTPWGCFAVAGEVRNAYTDQPIGGVYLRTVTSDHISDPSFSSATGPFSLSACSGVSRGNVRVEARCLFYLPTYATVAYTDWQNISGLIVYLSPESSDPQIGSGDYDGDGSSEIAIYRPSTAQWAIRDLTSCYFGSWYGQYVPAPADYDGDGTTDVALFAPWHSVGDLNPSDPLWAIRGLTRFYYGNFTDIPIPGDWDGDGCADAAVFQGGKNLWAVRNVTRIYFGQQGDQPLNTDFTGDGRRTAAVYRASQGLWAIRDLTRIYLGNSTDQVDALDCIGDGTDLPAIFRSSSGLWAVHNLSRFYFGSSGDKSVPGDYPGSGQDLPTVFRGSSGLWGVRDLTRVYFGSTGDIPVTR